MGGFFGFGQSGQESTSNKDLNNVFNYGLSTSQGQQSRGQQNLADATSYFKSLLAPGRTQATANAAPIVNAATDQADTIRRQEAAQGTGRGGGTAGENREASGTTAKTIDDVINENLQSGKKTGAAGLTQAGNTNLTDAAQLLGIGTGAASDTLKGAISKEDSQTAAFSKIISSLL